MRVPRKDIAKVQVVCPWRQFFVQHRILSDFNFYSVQADYMTQRINYYLQFGRYIQVHSIIVIPPI